MNTARSILVPLLAAACVAAAPRDLRGGPLKVIATHPALGSIAAQVGGDRVDVTSIALPTADVHAVEAKPSVFAQLAAADVFIHSGLDLELWRDPAAKGSRNPRIQDGQPGAIDASAGIHLLQVPEVISRREGDIHLFGNPHYWMDPINGLAIAKTLAAGFTAIDPAGAPHYLERQQAFEADLKGRLKGWLVKALPFKNTPLVVYHDSFPYFVRRFGFRVVATVEPKPRIPPTQSHLLGVLNTIREQAVQVVVREPFHDEDATRFLAEQTGVKVVTLSTLPGFAPGSASYQDLIEADLEAILGALR